MPTKLENYNKLKDKLITTYQDALDFRIDAFFNLYKSHPDFIPGTITQLRHKTCEEVIIYAITFQHTSIELMDSLAQVSPNVSYDYSSFLSISLMDFTGILGESIAMLKWENFEFEISHTLFRELHKKYMQSYIISQTTNESIFKIGALSRILDKIEQHQIEFDTVETLEDLTNI